MSDMPKSYSKLHTYNYNAKPAVYDIQIGHVCGLFLYDEWKTSISLCVRARATE